jgi:hypothetical protein
MTTPQPNSNEAKLVNAQLGERGFKLTYVHDDNGFLLGYGISTSAEESVWKGPVSLLAIKQLINDPDSAVKP